MLVGFLALGMLIGMAAATSALIAGAPVLMALALYGGIGSLTVLSAALALPLRAQLLARQTSQ